MLRRGPRHRHLDPADLSRSPRSALACACAALALASCGGDEAQTTTAAEPPPPTRQEFLFEADRICFAAESQIEAAADDLVTGDERPEPAEVRRIADTIVVPQLRSEAKAIRLLEPPPGDEKEIERILEATERGADQIEADPVATIDGVPPALRQAERLARAYGSQECGIR